MLGNFTFHNPTKLYFGEEALSNLSKELEHYGKKVMLVYGGGSIKRNGIYDAVKVELLKAGKEVVELGGVMPNPTIDKVREGIKLAKEKAVDFILAVGGGCREGCGCQQHLQGCGGLYLFGGRPLGVLFLQLGRDELPLDSCGLRAHHGWHGF